MKRMQPVGAAVMVLAALAMGCGKSEQPIPEPVPQDSHRCDPPTEYLAFDAASPVPAQLQLQRMDGILALFDEASQNVATAGSKASQALALYQAADARLQASVRSRKDMRSSPAALVGPELDSAITGAIEELRTATTVHQVRVARQHADASGLSRFLYLSVMEALLDAPSREHYDEAYGYLGTGQTNTESGRQGLAHLATAHDAVNETALAPDLFRLVIDGACTIEGALLFLGKDSFAPEEDEQYVRITRMIDARLQLVLLYSLGHELFAYTRASTDAQGARLALIGAQGFLRTLEPSLTQQGEERSQLAQDLRAAIEASLAASRPDDTAWISSFQAQQFLDRLQAAWFINVKG
jgi:hypothetical protein